MTEDTRSKSPIGFFLFGAVTLLVLPVLLMSLAGDWGWWEGWVFSLWYIGLSYTAVFYQYRKDPALLAERREGQRAANRPVWDRRWSLLALIGFLGWLVVMPLEARRYQWTDGFPTWVQIVGLVGLIPSAYLILKTYFVNTYLSSVVRLQQDRGQRVVTTGVYGFVRHPLYLGACLFFICGPLLMDSFFGALTGFLMVLLFAYRSSREEKLLLDELEGYGEYQQKIRYRLIPGIW